MQISDRVASGHRGHHQAADLHSTIVVTVLLLLAAPLTAQMQDTVVLRSGNLVVGEVQSLRRGSLAFDTEEMDVVQIDWEDIATVTSSQHFEVILASGARYYGRIHSTDTALLAIVSTVSAETVPFDDVVSIDPIETGFLARTNGFIDVGTNVARANRQASVLAKGRFNYRGPKWGFNANGESYWQRQESVSETADTTTQETSRNSISLTVSRSLAGRWALVGSGEVEQNQELNLDLRLLGVLGGAYQIVMNRGAELSVGVGASVNDEQYTEEERSTSMEVLGGVRFDAFDIGDVDVYTSITTYTRPTDGGRFRVNFDARIAWEILNDFTIGLNITERFDSKPPAATAPTRDYQYAFSIGWSWN